MNKQTFEMKSERTGDTFLLNALSIEQAVTAAKIALQVATREEIETKIIPSINGTWRVQLANKTGMSMWYIFGIKAAK